MNYLSLSFIFFFNNSGTFHSDFIIFQVLFSFLKKLKIYLFLAEVNTALQYCTGLDI